MWSLGYSKSVVHFEVTHCMILNLLVLLALYLVAYYVVLGLHFSVPVEKIIGILIGLIGRHRLV